MIHARDGIRVKLVETVVSTSKITTTKSVTPCDPLDHGLEASNGLVNNNSILHLSMSLGRDIKIDESGSLFTKLVLRTVVLCT